MRNNKSDKTHAISGPISFQNRKLKVLNNKFDELYKYKEYFSEITTKLDEKLLDKIWPEHKRTCNKYENIKIWYFPSNFILNQMGLHFSEPVSDFTKKAAHKGIIIECLSCGNKTLSTPPELRIPSIKHTFVMSIDGEQAKESWIRYFDEEPVSRSWIRSFFQKIKNMF